MANFNRCVELAEGWFERHLIETSSGCAGWGWVPDVPPNPQNTAEVVCALTRIGRPVPDQEAVIAMMRRQIVAHASQGEWVFRSVLDYAWRLRGLRCVVPGPEDSDIVSCAKELVAVQANSPGGGWPLTNVDDADSITATCLALHALLGLESSEVDVKSSVTTGLRMLIDAVLDDDPRVEPLYASAQIVQILALPDVASISGPRGERALEQTMGVVSTHLERGPAGIEEEEFTREGVTDVWRHMSLYLSLSAMAEADPDSVFEPPFRRALIEMLDLQEDDDPGNINYGGFRTARDGFVTSFATTQALHALAAVNATLAEHVNPGLAFDMLCQSEGNHHSDPQKVVTITGRSVVMNSWAGAVVLLIGSLATLTIAALAIGFEGRLGVAGSRLLLVWSLLFVAGGAFAFALLRWPAISKRAVALGVSTAFLSAVLPIVIFVFE